MNHRIIDVPLPFEGHKGVCVFCGSPLPPRKRRWCGNCTQEFLRQRGFTYRSDAIEQNRNRFGRITCEKCSRHPEQEYLIDQWVADHKVPLAAGGTHEKSNLQFLCPECNYVKTAEDLSALSASRNNAILIEQRTRSNHKLEDYP